MTIQQLLHYTIENKASDLHLVVGSPPMIRLDGDLIAVAGEEVLNPMATEQLLTGVMNTELRQVFGVNKEADFSFTLEDGGRFRVNAYCQKNTQAASFSLIP